MIVNVPWLPSGAKGMAPFPPLILIVSGYATDELIRHEEIHHCQQIECGACAFFILLAACLFFGLSLWTLCASVFAFYLLYFGEIALTKIRTGYSWKRSYYESMLEKEARANEGDEGYIEKRKLFAFINYI